jgi:hypothetical protein
VHFLMGILFMLVYSTCCVYRTVLYIYVDHLEKKKRQNKIGGRCWPSAYTAIRNASNVLVIRSLSKTLTSSVLLLEEELSYPPFSLYIHSSIICNSLSIG